MRSKSVLLILFFLLLLFPIYAIYELESIEADSSLDIVISNLNLLQLSIWSVWLFMAIIAVFFKWKKKNDILFNFIYIFLVIGFCFLGYYTDELNSYYEIPDRMKPRLPFGSLITLKNLAVSVAFTAFLQFAVFWFSTKWHRR